MRSERVIRKTGPARAAAGSGDAVASDEAAVIDAGAERTATTCDGAADGATGTTDVAAVLAGATPQQRLGSAAFAGS